MTAEVSPRPFGTNVLVIDAQEFVTIATAAVAANSDSSVGGSVVTFNAAAIRTATAKRRLPADWANVKVTLGWVRAGVTGGDAVWRLYTWSAGPGDDISPAGTAHVAEITATAGAEDAYTATVLIASQAVTSGETTYFQIQRRATDAADTLNTAGIDCHLVELVVERV